MKSPLSSGLHVESSTNHFFRVWPKEQINLRAELGLLIEGCELANIGESVKDQNGGVFRTLEYTREGRPFQVCESLYPVNGALRWTIRIDDSGSPWSDAIKLHLRFNEGNTHQFWTTWGVPEPARKCRQDVSARIATGDLPKDYEAGEWRNPFEFMPFRDLLLHYGSPAYNYDTATTPYYPFHDDIFCIPMATVRNGNMALSAVLPLHFRIIELNLRTERDGLIEFVHLHQKIGGKRFPAFAIDLFAHEADWRVPLDYVRSRWPSHFVPKVENAAGVWGTGAYAPPAEQPNWNKLNAFGFGTLWRASFDFPFMGLFLPEDSSGTWVSTEGKECSIGQMREATQALQKHGVKVLEYFNVCEFGEGMNKEDLDQDPHGLKHQARLMLRERFPDALLIAPERHVSGDFQPWGQEQGAGKPFTSWRDCYVVDPGDPAFLSFLEEQTLRIMRLLPESSGIAIDRGDWLRLMNTREDDGETWFYGESARSLNNSWRLASKRLGEIVHGFGKVIFFNNHSKRIDQLEDIDGIWDEHAREIPSWNCSAMLCLDRPGICWINDSRQFKPNPDAFLQTHLYLGTLPMVPYPKGDHSICPDPEIEPVFALYGNLFKLMQNRRWCLKPNSVKLDGEGLANIFHVPGGMIIPVVHTAERKISVRLSNLAVCPGLWDVSVYCPGEPEIKLTRIQSNGKEIVVEIPLSRGCGVLTLTSAGIC